LSQEVSGENWQAWQHAPWIPLPAVSGRCSAQRGSEAHKRMLSRACSKCRPNVSDSPRPTSPPSVPSLSGAAVYRRMPAIGPPLSLDRRQYRRSRTLAALYIRSRARSAASARELASEGERGEFQGSLHQQGKAYVVFAMLCESRETPARRLELLASTPMPIRPLLAGVKIFPRRVPPMRAAKWHSPCATA